MSTRKLIDCTPTWQGILPILFELLDNSTPTGEQTARDQFDRMAQAADNWNAHCKRIVELPRHLDYDGGSLAYPNTAVVKLNDKPVVNFAPECFEFDGSWRLDIIEALEHITTTFRDFQRTSGNG